MGNLLKTQRPLRAEAVSASPMWQKDRERWDVLARTMPDLLPAASTQYYQRREIALIKRWFGCLDGKRVLKLDLWNEAVNTRILNWISSQGAEAYGIDFSHVVVSKAQGNSNDTNGSMFLVQSDIRQLPFENNTFDFIYTMGSIEHMDEYQMAIQELQRVLKVGGKAIVGVPHKWNIFLRPLFVRALDLFGKYPYSPEKSFSSRELHRVLELSGLLVHRRTGILAFPGILRMVEAFFYKHNIPLYWLSSLLLRPFDYIETRWKWPGLFGYLIALEVEKFPS